MKRRSRRLLKKLHKYWLGYGIIDASTHSYWRKRLYESSPGEVFFISRADSTGIHWRTAEAVSKYNLRYCVRVAESHETVAWLSEGGSILFKFWAADYPSVRMFSGNNPDVV